MIRYKLSDAKKKQNLMVGDGLAEIFKMALPYAKNILPKLATTVGLSSIGALASSAINKKINKKKNDTIIKLNDNQVKKINDNFKKINDSKIFDKKIFLEEQEGNGIFSFLLPTLVSLLPKVQPNQKWHGLSVVAPYNQLISIVSIYFARFKTQNIFMRSDDLSSIKAKSF